MNLLRFVSAAALAALSVASVVGCGAKVATVLASDDAGSQPTRSDSGEPEPSGGGDCLEKKGAVCLPSGESAPPNRRVAAPHEGRCGGTDVCWVLVDGAPGADICENDVQCNDPDSGLAVMMGMCFHGICVCNPGYHVQPGGRCGSTPPTSCAAQSGTCVRGTMSCPDGQISGEPATNATCESLTEQACCFEKAQCRGPEKAGTGGDKVPVDFACCAPNDAVHPPICVHGYQTCLPGDTPVDKATGGCG